MDPTRISYGTLTLLRADNSARVAFPLTKPVATFGRLAECDVRIVLPSVSKLHAELSVAEDFTAEIIVHSINGLLLNGISCERGTRKQLNSGDFITICERVFKFTTGGIETIAVDSPIPNRRTSIRRSLGTNIKLSTPVKTLASPYLSPAPLFSFDSPQQQIATERPESELFDLMAWDDEPVEAVDGANGDLITLDELEEEEDIEEEILEKVLTPVKELVKKFELVATPSLAHRARSAGIPASAQRAPSTQGGARERRRRSMRMTIIPSETAIDFVAEREALVLSRQESQSPLAVIKQSTPAKSPTKIASLSTQGTPSRPSSQLPSASAPTTPRSTSHSSTNSTPRMASANSSTSRRISALLLSGNGKSSLIGAFEDAEQDGQNALDDEDSESSEDEDDFGFEPETKSEEIPVQVELNPVAFEDAPVSPSPLQIVTNTPTLSRHSSARRHSLREKVLIRSAIKQSISPVESPVSLIYGGSAVVNQETTSAVDADEEELEVEEEIIIAMQESPTRSTHQHRDSIELTRTRSPAKSPSKSTAMPATPTPVSSVASSPRMTTPAPSPKVATPAPSPKMVPVVEIVMPVAAVKVVPSLGSPSPARIIAGRPRLSLAAPKLLDQAAAVPLPETPAAAPAPVHVQQAPAWTPSNHRRGRDAITATPIIFRVGATPVVTTVPTPAKVVAPATPVRAEMVPLPQTPADEAYSYTPRAAIVIAPSTPDQFEDRNPTTPEQDEDESFASSSDGAESSIEGDRADFQSEMTSPVNQHRVMATPRSALRPTSSHGPPLSHSTTYSNSLSSNSFLNSHRKLPTSTSTASFFANLVGPALQLSIPLSPSISSIANLSGMGNTPGTLKRKVAFNEEVFIQHITDIRDKRMHWDEERDFEVVAATPVKSEEARTRDGAKLAAKSPAARLNNTPRPISSRAATPSRSTPAAVSNPFVPIIRSLAPTETPTRRAQRVPTLTPAENVRRVLAESQPHPSPQRVPVENGAEAFASVLRRASRTALPVTPAVAIVDAEEEEEPIAQVSPTKSARRVPATPSKATALPSTTPTKSLAGSTSTRRPLPRSAAKSAIKKSVSKVTPAKKVASAALAGDEVEEGGEIMRASRMTLELSTPVVKKVVSKAPSSAVVRGRKVDIQKLLDTPISKGPDAAQAIKSVPRLMTVAGLREEVEVRRRLSMPSSAVEANFTFPSTAAIVASREVEAKEVEAEAEVEVETIEAEKVATPIRKLVPNHALSAPTPSFLGLKSLFTASPVAHPAAAPKTPSFTGFSKLFSSPSSVVGPSSMATPRYAGVRELMKEEQKVVGKTPRFAGIREMFVARKKREAGEYLVGVEELFDASAPAAVVEEEEVVPATVEEVVAPVVVEDEIVAAIPIEEEAVVEEKNVEQERKDLVDSIILEVGGDRQECASPVRSTSALAFSVSPLPSSPVVAVVEPLVEKLVEEEPTVEQEEIVVPVEVVLETPAVVEEAPAVIEEAVVAVEEAVAAVEEAVVEEEQEEAPVVAAPVRRGRAAKAPAAKRAPVARKSKAVIVAPEVVEEIAAIEEEIVAVEAEVVKKPAAKGRATRVARSAPVVEVEVEVPVIKRGRAAAAKKSATVVVAAVEPEVTEEIVEEVLEVVEEVVVAKPTRGRKAAVKKVVVEGTPAEEPVAEEEENVAPIPAKKATTTRAKRATKAAVIIHEDEPTPVEPIEKPTRAGRSTRAPLSSASNALSNETDPTPSAKPTTIAKGRKKAAVVEPSVEVEEEQTKENVAVVKKVAAKRAPAAKKVAKVAAVAVEEEQVAAPVGRSMRTRR